MFSNKNNIALGLALLFHFCGAIGILFTPYKEWFVNNTSTNLLLMAGLLFYTQKQKNSYFILFFAIAFCIGMGSEIIGVNTGKLFGNYVYGNVMGYKFKSVPILIGVQWFVTIYCSGILVTQMHGWVKRKSAEGNDIKLPIWLQFISLIIDGALTATFFDYVMEPVAIKLHFWEWRNADVPFFNYLCWFIISTILMLFFKLLPFNKTNQFAIHLFIIQALFFLTLRSFL